MLSDDASVHTPCISARLSALSGLRCIVGNVVPVGTALLSIEEPRWQQRITAANVLQTSEHTQDWGEGCMCVRACVRVCVCALGWRVWD